MDTNHVFTGTALPDDCTVCGHPFDPHIFVARKFALLVSSDRLSTEVPDSGLVFCPEPDCDCTSTWVLGIRGHYSAIAELPPDLLDFLPRFLSN
jgi:hypothetical protein